ncbi:MAG: heme exporter protein CcmD [Gammaproteobacteria bacterium]|jgi:heme exporter protein D|nr:heme exporter protein CcmD [Gammaproteobacteria bacterium]
MTEFLHMGGYATYVWSAYGITLVVLVANVVAAIRLLRNQRARLRQDYDDLENEE